MLTQSRKGAKEKTAVRTFSLTSLFRVFASSRLCVSLFLLLVSPFPARAGEFQFKDGDRVALVGSTLIEREQKYGYWELALTTRHPDKNITFRNLGWSGDTVWGASRVGFDLDN